MVILYGIDHIYIYNSWCDFFKEEQNIIHFQMGHLYYLQW